MTLTSGFSLQESIECPLLDRWAQYLAGRSDDDLCASPELKGLLRVGVPQEYRQRVWSWMVRARTRTIREHHPQCYQQVGAQPVLRQILTLVRTPVHIVDYTPVQVNWQ